MIRKMEIIEQFTTGKKGNQETSEDALAINSCFAAVVDGCSCRFSVTYDGLTPGQIAARIAREAVLELCPETTAEEAASYMNSKFLKWYKEAGILETVTADRYRRCSCYYAMYSAYRRQVWVLGDCQALVGGHLITSKKTVDTLHELLRSYIIRVKVLKGDTEKSLEEHQQDLRNIAKIVFESQPLFQNTSDNLFGYSCIDGFYLPGPMYKVYDIPDGVTEVVLASDGYPVLKGTLAETEAELHKLLESDPLCYKKNLSVKGVLPGNVSYDDRSYVRIAIKPSR